MEAAERKPETKSPPLCMKRFAPSALCTLVLGLVLGACPSLNVGSDIDNLHGAVTVSFDKNNSDAGSTQAKPDNITILPPATTLGTLPEKPMRPGYAFAGWNMQSDGKGEAFTEKTPIQKKIHFVVYAKWEPVLNAQLSTDTLTFSPIEDKFSFKLTVSGFKSEADANSVGLDSNIDELSWLFLGSEPDKVSWDSKTFVVHVAYRGQTFAEAPATLKLTPKNIPAGYAYSDGAQTLHIVPTNGKDKTRPIPVHRGNIERFNNHARTDGLALHYQLMENVTLSEKPNNWTAIGTNTAPFTGSFDGGGHSISGLNINLPNTNHQGLFGYILGEEAVIQNLGLEGGSVSGGNYVGGVVGYNDKGTVQNCHATGDVSGNSNGNGNRFNLYVGGVVGVNSGKVQNCYASGDVTGNGNSNGEWFQLYVGGVVGGNSGKVQNCYASGDVSGNSNGNGNRFSLYVGGVVGQNSGEVHNSHYTKGDVRGNGNNNGEFSRLTVGGVVGENSSKGKVLNSYATGDVNGNGNNNDIYFSLYIGGVVGNNNGEVHNSYYATGDVSGSGNNNGSYFSLYVGGVAGYNSRGTVQNCYASGNVSGSSYSSYVGGVAGHNGEESTVQNCVALNPSVTLTSTANSYVGRVVGRNMIEFIYTAGTLTNNHARNPDMQLTRNGTPKNPLDKGPGGVDGADVSAEEYSDSSFWEKLCIAQVGAPGICWDFQNVWKWEEGLLPILREVGGEQTPRVQP